MIFDRIYSVSTVHVFWVSIPGPMESSETRKRQHINIVPILALTTAVCVCVCMSICVAGYALLYTRKTHCVSYIQEFNINNVAPVGPQYVNVAAHNATTTKTTMMMAKHRNIFCFKKKSFSVALLLWVETAQVGEYVRSYTICTILYGVFIAILGWLCF